MYSLWGLPLDKNLLTVREVTLFGILAALTFGAKVAMSALPNIEPVTLFVLVFGAVFGWKALFIVYVYVLAEILFYGIGTWNINYLYVWLVLMVLALAMRRLQNPLWWAGLSGLFGLAFGLLCSPVYMVTMNSVSYGIRWWQAGLPFDITHGIGNFVMARLLFVPLRRLLEKLYRTMQ